MFPKVARGLISTIMLFLVNKLIHTIAISRGEYNDSPITLYEQLS